MLTKLHFKNASYILGCEPEVIEAVSQVEAPRGAFDTNGKLTILFEAHIFWKELRKKGIDPNKFLPAYANVLSPVWNSALYGKYSQQWNRLEYASSISKEAAYRSTSYGAFQILGNNAESLGYKDVFAFVDNEASGEEAQLEDFCKYILINHLDDELKNKDWAGFARGYNGPLYTKNNYDKKLEAAYEKLKA